MTFPRRIAAVAAAVAIVMIASFYFLALSPQMKDLKAANAAHAAAEAKIGQLQEQTSQLQALVKQIPADTADLAGLEQRLPDNPSLDAALTQLHVAATASGVILTTLAPTVAGAGSSGATRQPGGPTVSLALSVTGSPDQISAFLNQLNQMPRVVVVDHVGITGTGTTTTGNISARVFYAGQPTP